MWGSVGGGGVQNYLRIFEKFEVRDRPPNTLQSLLEALTAPPSPPRHSEGPLQGKSVYPVLELEQF